MTALFAALAFAACLIGKICGMGGGVLMKPVLDASGLLEVAAVNFLSGICVLGMSLWSVGRGFVRREEKPGLRIATPLALGAACGGLLGRELFRLAAARFQDAEKAAGIQAALLFAATLCTLLYTLRKDALPSHHVEKAPCCMLIGLALGCLGSFLGIGGGPFNMAVLFFFFSMPVKEAAKDSLYIILISQAAALLFSLLTAGLPSFPPVLMPVMAGCAVLGSEAGSRIAARISDRKTTVLFMLTMVLVMGICVYNFRRSFGP